MVQRNNKQRSETITSICISQWKEFQQHNLLVTGALPSVSTDVSWIIKCVTDSAFWVQTIQDQGSLQIYSFVWTNRWTLCSSSAVQVRGCSYNTAQVTIRALALTTNTKNPKGTAKEHRTGSGAIRIRALTTYFKFWTQIAKLSLDWCSEKYNSQQNLIKF